MPLQMALFTILMWLPENSKFHMSPALFLLAGANLNNSTAAPPPVCPLSAASQKPQEGQAGPQLSRPVRMTPKGSHPAGPGRRGVPVLHTRGACKGWICSYPNSQPRDTWGLNSNNDAFSNSGPFYLPGNIETRFLNLLLPNIYDASKSVAFLIQLFFKYISHHLCIT